MKILLLLSLFTISAFGQDLKKHPIYAQIIKNKPGIDKEYAMEVSNIIYKMHKKYHIPSRIFTAILMQESGYSLKAKGKHCGYTKELERECIYSDYGISQIHYITAELWGFDVNKLTIDLEYSVESGAKVLHDVMKRFKSKDDDYWVRYNCGFRGDTKRDTCQIYKKFVERYL